MAMKDEAARTAPPEKLPADTLRDALPLLRRPFTPEAVKFKVQTVFKEAKGCIVVAYIDARLVIERLNAVAGGEWADAYVPAGEKTMRCDLTVFGTTRQGFGKEAGIEPEKSRESDSLKRAAVKFGVGVSTYAVPQITLFMDNTGRLEKHNGPKGPTLKLTEQGHVKLREGYGAWLERVAATFGEPLDHGDLEGETIDPEAEAVGFVPEGPAPLEDDKAEALVARCKGLFDRIREKDPQAVTPGQFNGWLTGAAHSHDQMARLAEYLEQRLAEVKA